MKRTSLVGGGSVRGGGKGWGRGRVGRGGLAGRPAPTPAPPRAPVPTLLTPLLPPPFPGPASPYPFPAPEGEGLAPGRRAALLAALADAGHGERVVGRAGAVGLGVDAQHQDGRLERRGAWGEETERAGRGGQPHPAAPPLPRADSGVRCHSPPAPVPARWPEPHCKWRPGRRWGSRQTGPPAGTARKGRVRVRERGMALAGRPRPGRRMPPRPTAGLHHGTTWRSRGNVRAVGGRREAGWRTRAQTGPATRLPWARLLRRGGRPAPFLVPAPSHRRPPPSPAPQPPLVKHRQSEAALSHRGPREDGRTGCWRPHTGAHTPRHQRLGGWAGCPCLIEPRRSTTHAVNMRILNSHNNSYTRGGGRGSGAAGTDAGRGRQAVPRSTARAHQGAAEGARAKYQVCFKRAHGTQHKCITTRHHP